MNPPWISSSFDAFLEVAAGIYHRLKRNILIVVPISHFRGITIHN